MKRKADLGMPERPWDAIIHLTRLREKRPIAFYSAAIAILAVFLGSAILDQQVTNRRLEKEAEERLLERAGPDLRAQMKKLEELRADLHGLSVFIKAQEEKLHQEESLLQELSKERQSLEPVVRTQRGVIDAIFRVQEERSNRARFVEWLIAFGVGVLSSLLASLATSLITRRSRRNVAPNTGVPADN